LKKKKKGDKRRGRAGAAKVASEGKTLLGVKDWENQGWEYMRGKTATADGMLSDDPRDVREHGTGEEWKGGAT